MRASEQAGSAALPQRLTAFGGVVAVLCNAGLAPVIAVVLALLASVVLARV